MTRTLVFAHANGFPAGTYRELFKIWRAAGWRVVAPEMLGHDPRYPVASNWSRLRDQLIDLATAEVDGPFYLAGHSLGGLLGLLVACKRPDLVAGLVMLDSPVVTGWRAHSVRLLKTSGLIERFSPGRISRARRREWASRQDAAAHFAAKPTFARWPRQVLDDYIDCGMRAEADRAVLAFDREVETRIYDTLPHHFGRLLRAHPPRCPVGFIAGTQSAEMRMGGSYTARRLAGERLRRIAGTHLYPMERPDETARLVLELLDGMAPQRAAEAARSAACSGA